MQLEITSLVTDSKVALGHLGLGCVEGHLVAGQPALVANNGGAVNGGPSKIEVNVAAKVNIFTLVGCLDFTALLPVIEVGWGLIYMQQSQLQLHHFNVLSNGHY